MLVNSFNRPSNPINTGGLRQSDIKFVQICWKQSLELVIKLGYLNAMASSIVSKQLNIKHLAWNNNTKI